MGKKVNQLGCVTCVVTSRCLSRWMAASRSKHQQQHSFKSVFLSELTQSKHNLCDSARHHYFTGAKRLPLNCRDCSVRVQASPANFACFIAKC